jgi:hypothetical protein
VPAKPKFTLKNIERRPYDEDSSCSVPGLLTLEVARTDAVEIGYIFKIIRGSLGSEIFPKTPVSTSGLAEPNVFHFIFFEHGSEYKPMDIVVEITPVSKAGGKGEPTYLNISHPGIEKPWWMLW